MASILISSSEKYSGKSSLCTGIGIILRNKGHSVGYMKPIGNMLVDVNGVLSDEDAEQMRKVFDLKDDINSITPILLTDNLAEDALAGVEKHFDRTLSNAFAEVSKDKDVVLIEGTGGIGGGAMYGLSDPQVSSILGTKMLLVTRYDSVYAVDRILCDIKLINDPDMLAGIILNEVDEGQMTYVCELVVPFLESKGIKVVGVLPKDSTLRSVPISEIVEDLHAEVLAGSEHLEELVEHYLVGAMEVNSAIKYFRRNPGSVVITGGDRADIQMAAIEARVKCLVLTGNLQPSGAVLGSADEAGIPVVLVRGDTMSTIGRMEGLIGHARFRQEHKLDRMVELIENNVDINNLLSIIGL
ncbi:phosphotransacetylase family protein [Methanococcoides orientis]|uniref:phosphotransacetylase family protein n=1 Tax=Methanococcoides orientis TaxID=2822137 RepID=UPI001E424702|nr:phosphotransacetylase family protein [Methanococcoides orientis]UGV40073.1 phosphotransacetylase family protein [Methanococcoides orientis]